MDSTVEAGRQSVRFARSDLIVAALILVLGQAETWIGGNQRRPIVAAVGVVMVAAPLLVRRLHPLAACLAVTTMTSAQAWVGVDLRQPVYILPAGLLAVYSLAAWAPPLRAVIGFAAAWIIEAAGALHRADADVSEIWFIGTAFGVAFMFGVAWKTRHMRAETLAAVVETHDEVDAERRAAAVAAERARIARELHDIVAHNITVISVQAGAAGLMLDRDRDQTRVALDDIRSTAQTTLNELRHLLTLLRSTPEATAAPMPGLADLPALVERAAISGVDGQLSVEGDPPTNEPGLELTLYRIVQEALTNAIRHGQASRIDIRLVFTGGEATVCIEDDGRAVSPPNPGGHGLVGMRERLDLYDGSLDVGPMNGRGFRVRAAIPLRGATA